VPRHATRAQHSRGARETGGRAERQQRHDLHHVDGPSSRPRSWARARDRRTRRPARPRRARPASAGAPRQRTGARRASRTARSSGASAHRRRTRPPRHGERLDHVRVNFVYPERNGSPVWAKFTSRTPAAPISSPAPASSRCDRRSRAAPVPTSGPAARSHCARGRARTARPGAPHQDRGAGASPAMAAHRAARRRQAQRRPQRDQQAQHLRRLGEIGRRREQNCGETSSSSAPRSRYANRTNAARARPSGTGPPRTRAAPRGPRADRLAEREHDGVTDRVTCRTTASASRSPTGCAGSPRRSGTLTSRPDSSVRATNW